MIRLLVALWRAILVGSRGISKGTWIFIGLIEAGFVAFGVWQVVTLPEVGWLILAATVTLPPIVILVIVGVPAFIGLCWEAFANRAPRAARSVTVGALVLFWVVFGIGQIWLWVLSDEPVAVRARGAVLAVPTWVLAAIVGLLAAAGSIIGFLFTIQGALLLIAFLLYLIWRQLLRMKRL